jgi:hypothetical protein
LTRIDRLMQLAVEAGLQPEPEDCCIAEAIAPGEVPSR